MNGHATEDCEDYRGLQARLDVHYRRRFIENAFSYFCYAIYLVFQTVLAPLLGLRSLLIAKHRGYSGLSTIRLLGGSKPPHRSRWVVVVAGGLGEVRAGWEFAEKLAEARGVDVAVLVKSVAASKLTHSRLFTGVLPFSNPISVLIFLLRWRPKAIIAVEFFANHHLAAMSSIFGIRSGVFNVPITQFEANRLKLKNRWRQPLIGAYFCQDESNQDRIVRSGSVPIDRTLVTGPACITVRPAQGLDLDPEQVRSSYAEKFHIQASDFPIIVAGSTYHPEELILIDAFKRLLNEFPLAVMIIAPRGISRPEGVDSALRERKTAFARVSEMPSSIPDSRIFLLDTTGELKHVYSVATIAFVGGTFNEKGTGHTPVEAVAWGVPCTIGPFHPQQKTIVEILARLDAIRVCEDAAELVQAWLLIARDDSYRIQVSRRLEDFRTASDGAALAIYDTIVGASDGRA